jgi:hypothetical protein
MDVGTHAVIAQIVQTIVGFGVTGVVILGLGFLVFPSTRAVLAGWLHGLRRDEIDGEAVLAQLASANAQLAALRGEVYALRCEVTSRPALQPEPRPASLPSRSPTPNVS